MSKPTHALWFGLTVALLALPSRAADDLYTTQIVEQARQWQQKNRDDLAANLWLKVLVVEPKHPEALMSLGAIKARAAAADKGGVAEVPPKIDAKEVPANTAATMETQKKLVPLPDPTVTQAQATRPSSSQSKKSRPASAAKLSTSTGEPLDGRAAKKPRAAGATDLNFSTSLDPGQAKSRP